MDALALLCNLHAEGPATLARLRAAGVRTLEDLLALDAEERVRLTRSEDPARLEREARHLLGRVQPLEDEEEPRASAPPAREAPRATAATPGALRSRRSDPSFGRPPLQRAAAAPLRPAGAARAAEPTLAPRRECPEPSAGPAAEDRGLVPELVDDLDPALCDALLGAGVRTLDELVAASGLSLARRTGVAFTRLLELQLRAQRVREATVTPSPRRSGPVPAVPAAPAAPAEKLEAPPDPPSTAAVAAPRDRRLTDRLGDAAGPFA